ncbi:hypothetical protein [Clostridium sp. ZS1]|uniref:hypothetical protein n=1 Tax=Clostridium sp. ZS1 TaxID=2949989 RepID=UPI00207A8E0F|nr:hypothetical protein [Clostridium sp. ZS1]
MGREYVDTIRANKATLKKMEKAQFAIFKRLNNDYDNDDLNKAFNAISGISTILGLICKIHPAVNAVTVIAGVCGSLRKGEQESLARMG